MKETTGIDYGNGIVNVDSVTRIRYGVIPANDLLQTWADESKAIYEYHCPKCGSRLKQGCEAKRCSSCKTRIEDGDLAEMDPIGFVYQTKALRAQQSFDDPDIFITKSPFFTYCQFCSPCAPGAGNLRTPLKYPHGVKTYCFGPDWFDNNEAPYDVFSVKTSKIIYRETITKIPSLF